MRQLICEGRNIDVKTDGSVVCNIKPSECPKIKYQGIFDWSCFYELDHDEI
jgi:hypothetical protein